MTKKITIISLAFLAMILVLTGCKEGKPETSSYIEVTGSSIVYMNADEATFTVSSEYIAKTTDEARQGTDTIIQSAVSILKDNYNVLDKDIATGYLSLSPYYEWKDNNRVLAGQRGNQSINVTISDISKVGNIVEDLSRVNGISVSSIKLDKADKTEEIEKARSLAVKNAIEKATTYAEAADREIGEVVFISDSVSPDYGYRSDNLVMMEEAAPKSAAGTTYYAYDLSVKDNVHIRVEMK